MTNKEMAFEPRAGGSRYSNMTVSKKEVYLDRRPSENSRAIGTIAKMKKKHFGRRQKQATSAQLLHNFMAAYM